MLFWIFQKAQEHVGHLTDVILYELRQGTLISKDSILLNKGTNKKCLAYAWRDQTTTHPSEAQF